MRSCDAGEVLWNENMALSYSPQASSSGNIMVDLIAQAVTAALEKGTPNYMPLAQQAHYAAAWTMGQGLPADPYLKEIYGKDSEAFPSK
jgi:hypothetical protein